MTEVAEDSIRLIDEVVRRIAEYQGEFGLIVVNKTVSKPGEHPFVQEGYVRTSLFLGVLYGGLSVDDDGICNRFPFCDDRFVLCSAMGLLSERVISSDEMMTIQNFTDIRFLAVSLDEKVESDSFGTLEAKVSVLTGDKDVYAWFKRYGRAPLFYRMAREFSKIYHPEEVDEALKEYLLDSRREVDEFIDALLKDSKSMGVFTQLHSLQASVQSIGLPESSDFDVFKILAERVAARQK